jgi:Uma2 family endonuclease
MHRDAHEAARRFVPDPRYCRILASAPALLPDSPPLIAIEVLSPDDRLTAVREKLQEYRAWGVPHVWLVDPHSRRLYNCDTGLTEVASFAVPELGVKLGPVEIFD